MQDGKKWVAEDWESVEKSVKKNRSSRKVSLGYRLPLPVDQVCSSHAQVCSCKCFELLDLPIFLFLFPLSSSCGGFLSGFICNFWDLFGKFWLGIFWNYQIWVLFFPSFFWSLWCCNFLFFCSHDIGSESIWVLFLILTCLFPIESRMDWEETWVHFESPDWEKLLDCYLHSEGEVSR